MAAARIAVIGIGAIGGWVASRLSQAGNAVSALARGETLKELKANGLQLDEGGRISVCRIAASDEARDLGPQDIVIVAVKAHSLLAVAPQVKSLVTGGTIVIPMMNGVPWWFFAGSERQFALRSIDPDGEIAHAIPPQLVIGCVVHASSTLSGPARIRHSVGNGLIFGEAIGGESERLTRVVALMRDAKFDASASTRIQREVWYKLWGNMTMNPMSAITGAASDVILDDPLARGLMLSAMAEAKEIGRRIGCAIEESGEDRIAVARKLGSFKTSMLQDVEAGRTPEIEALLSAPREIAAQVGVPTPSIDALLGLMRVFVRVRNAQRVTSPGP